MTHLSVEICSDSIILWVDGESEVLIYKRGESVPHQQKQEFEEGVTLMDESEQRIALISKNNIIKIHHDF